MPALPSLLLTAITSFKDVAKSSHGIFRISHHAEASARPPRFYSQADLPVVTGSCIELSPAESKHATRVLRLGSEALVEVCNGQGQMVSGRLITTSKTAAHVVTTMELQQVAWQGPKWELAVACGTLQSGRTDWLIEKCTELGAWSFRPVLTERSPGIGWKGVGKAGNQDKSQGSGRTDRWQRIADAASKQSLRAHSLILQPAVRFKELLPLVGAAPTAWVGAAGGSTLKDQAQAQSATHPCERDSVPSLLIIGPEGDFTMAELEQLTRKGAQLVSLGSHRLRVETAALAMLSAAQLLAA